MSYIYLTRNEFLREIELKCGESHHATRSHIHNQWSIGYVVTGITDIQVGIKRLSIRAGQYLAVPKATPHLCQPRPATPFTFRVLYVPTEPLVSENRKLYAQCLVGECAFQEFRAIANGLIHAEDLDTLSSRIIQLSAFLRVTQTQAIDDVQRNLSKVDLLRLGDRRDEDQSRYRRYYQSRKNFGVGPKDLETIQKIERAKKHLIEDFKLADIAQECGFYDQSHFTKTFKQYTGLTPSQFKEMR